jgi:hypothetical protein
MVKFKCLRSGNFIELSSPDDIDGLRKHEGYIEVKEIYETKEIQRQEPEAPRQVLKLRGRPKK